jgi:endonuclease III-like uncharacterized protein
VIGGNDPVGGGLWSSVYGLTQEAAKSILQLDSECILKENTFIIDCSTRKFLHTLRRLSSRYTRVSEACDVRHNSVFEL